MHSKKVLALFLSVLTVWMLSFLLSSCALERPIVQDTAALQSDPVEARPAEQPAETSKATEMPEPVAPEEKLEKKMVAVDFSSKSFESSNIYVIDYAKAAVYQVTDEASNNMCPQLSPDGKKIVFYSDREGNFDIYTVHPDGSSLKSITDTPYNKYVPRFSPDGQKICYIADEEGYTDVYVIDADGSEKRQIVKNGAENYNAIWGADPETIIYVSNEKENFDIYSIGLDGTGKKQLSDDEYFAENLSLSPDGRNLLYAAGKIDSTVFEIFTLDLWTLEIAVLTDNMSYSRLPLWALNGRKIVYVADHLGFTDIFFMDIATKESINLTESANYELLLGISQDGGIIFYQSTGEDTHSLHMFDLETAADTILIEAYGL
jgi:Tol biopolymer transport system component